MPKVLRVLSIVVHGFLAGICITKFSFLEELIKVCSTDTN